MPANLGNGCHSSFELVLVFVMDVLIRWIKLGEDATTGGGVDGGLVVVVSLGDVDDGGVGG